MNNIEQRLKSNLVNEKVDALFDAFELGIEGIKLIASALQDKEREVRQYAWFLLSESDLAIAKHALCDYSIFSQFVCLSTINKFRIKSDRYDPGYLEYFAISNSKSLLITYWVGHDNLVQTYDLLTGKEEKFTYLPPGHVDEFSLGLNGKLIITSYQHHYYTNYTDTLKETRKFYESYGHVFLEPTCGGFSISEKNTALMASGSNHEQKLEVINYQTHTNIIKYNLNNKEQLAYGLDLYLFQKKDSYCHFISPLIFSPNEKFLVANFINSTNQVIHTIKIWNIETKELLQTLDNLPRLAITSLGINLDRKIIACGIREDKICVWELQSDSIIYTIDEIAPCIISDDGRILIHATANYEIVIRDLINNKALNILRGHNAPIMHLTMSEDREFIASYSSDKTIKIWGIV